MGHFYHEYQAGIQNHEAYDNCYIVQKNSCHTTYWLKLKVCMFSSKEPIQANMPSIISKSKSSQLHLNLNCINNIQTQLIYIQGRYLFPLYQNYKMRGIISLLCIAFSAFIVLADLIQPAPPTEIYAVAAGFPISYSCAYLDIKCWVPELDSDGAWCACTDDLQQWIKISSLNLENWVGVITQGRSKHDQRVEEFYITYTTDGISWQMLDGGRVFKGNNDPNTRVRNNFTAPVRARAIRLHPIKWLNHISVRFEGIFSVTNN